MMNRTIDDANDIDVRIIAERVLARCVDWVIGNTSQCKMDLFFVLRRRKKFNWRDWVTTNHVWDQ